MWRTVFLTLIWLLTTNAYLHAQNLRPCGNTGGASPWLKNYQRNPNAWRKANDTLLLVPLTVHLVGSDEGFGYFPLVGLLNALCQLNADFSQANIQFFLAGPIRFVPNTAWDSHSTILQGAAMMFANNVPNTLNCYIVTDAASNCGYNLPYAGIALTKSCSGAGSHTWAHEAGHALGLPHPFLGWEGGVRHDNSVPPDFSNPAPEFVTYDYTLFKDTLLLDTLIIDTAWVERVDGSNCHFAADGFCDTSPDYLATRWNCNANRQSAQTQLDPDGIAFRSDGTLIMSYANDACQTRFTDEQTAAMRAFLLDRRPQWVSVQPPQPPLHSAAALASPVNGQPSPHNATVLRWIAVPSATQYVIHLSRLVNFGVRDEFLVVNDTTLALGELLPNRTYYWRVRAFNAYHFCSPWSQAATFNTFLSTAVSELEQHSPLVVFPNPAGSGQFIAFSYKAAPVRTATLISPWGQCMLLTEQGGQWRLPAVSPGVYTIRADTEQGILVQRLVVWP